MQVSRLDPYSPTLASPLDPSPPCPAGCAAFVPSSVRSWAEQVAAARARKGKKKALRLPGRLSTLLLPVESVPGSEETPSCQNPCLCHYGSDILEHVQKAFVVCRRPKRGVARSCAVGCSMASSDSE